MVLFSGNQNTPVPQRDALALACFVFLAISVTQCSLLGWCLRRMDEMKSSLARARVESSLDFCFNEEELAVGDVFILGFQRTAKAVHANARSKGFWDRNPQAPELIALAHSELSEMLEAYRKGDGPSTKIPPFTAAEEELADLVIRAMDMSEGLGLRLAEAIEAKVAYNAPREYMHGKKF